MFCSPWDCQWKAPDQPFVFRLADGRPQRKSPTLPMHSSESRSAPKTPANMPSLRQLEFGFQAVAASLWDASHFTQRSGYKASDLETAARQLLCSLGAKRIATELRVEWNSRLKTAAGRADHRQKLISLNPKLVEHPAEIDRTLRHELAHILAQFRAGRRRISPHGSEWQHACRDLGIAGEKRCHTLPFPAKRYARRFVYRCPNCRRDSLAYARSNAQSPVWPVAARIAVATSMYVFDYGW